MPIGGGIDVEPRRRRSLQGRHHVLESRTLGEEIPDLRDARGVGVLDHREFIVAGSQSVEPHVEFLCGRPAGHRDVQPGAELPGVIFTISGVLVCHLDEESVKDG